MKISIAVAVGENGKVKTCGPGDYDASCYRTSMDAAQGWLLECGETMSAAYYVVAEIPNEVPEIQGRTRPAKAL